MENIYFCRFASNKVGPQVKCGINLIVEKLGIERRMRLTFTGTLWIHVGGLTRYNNYNSYTIN